MNIRRAEADDIAVLVDFNLKMAAETEEKSLDRAVLTSGVSAVLNDSSKGFYLVAEKQANIIGGLLITFEWSDWRNKWFWWIQSVYVVEESRGEGVYRALYEKVRSMAEKQGDVCGFRLYVEHENTVAQNVYEKLGMNRSGYLMYEGN